MAFLKLFKKKKPEKKPKAKKVKAKEPVGEKKVEKPAEVKEVKARPEVKLGLAYRVLKAPHVTEKASFLTGKNQYVFKVWPRANKNEVERAVEDVFGVEVIGVRMVNVPRKKRRLGKTEGFRKGYKKAIVAIKKGQKIEVLPR